MRRPGRPGGRPGGASLGVGKLGEAWLRRLTQISGGWFRYVVLLACLRACVLVSPARGRRPLSGADL